MDRKSTSLFEMSAGFQKIWAEYLQQNFNESVAAAETKSSDPNIIQ